MQSTWLLPPSTALCENLLPILGLDITKSRARAMCRSGPSLRECLTWGAMTMEMEMAMTMVTTTASLVTWKWKTCSDPSCGKTRRLILYLFARLSCSTSLYFTLPCIMLSRVFLLYYMWCNERSRRVKTTSEASIPKGNKSTYGPVFTHKTGSSRISNPKI